MNILFNTLVIIIGGIFILLGFIGCIMPVLPGPPLSFVGLLILAAFKGFSPPLTITLVLVMGLIAFIASGLDYIIPAIGARRYGASRWGVLGSVIGMLVGIFFFAPLGILIGGFLGAFLFEWFSGKEGKAALRAGKGVLIGGLLGTILKLVSSAIITYYFVYALFV